MSYERTLYSTLDPLFDIRIFLSKIWSIRYQGLSQLFLLPLFNITASIVRSHNPNLTPIVADINPIINLKEIKYPSDHFKVVLGASG